MFGDTAKSPIYQNTAFKLNSKSWSIWGSHWFLLFNVQWYENEIHHHKLAHLSGVWARHSVGIEAKGHGISHSNLRHSAYGCLWEGILFPWRLPLKLTLRPCKNNQELPAFHRCCCLLNNECLSQGGWRGLKKGLYSSGKGNHAIHTDNFVTSGNVIRGAALKLCPVIGHKGSTRFLYQPLSPITAVSSPSGTWVQWQTLGFLRVEQRKCL